GTHSITWETKFPGNIHTHTSDKLLGAGVTSATTPMELNQIEDAGNPNRSGNRGSYNTTDLSQIHLMESALEDQLQPFYLFALDHLEEAVVLVLDQRIIFANRSALEWLENFSGQPNFVEALV